MENMGSNATEAPSQLGDLGQNSQGLLSPLICGTGVNSPSQRALRPE